MIAKMVIPPFVRKNKVIFDGQKGLQAFVKKKVTTKIPVHENTDFHCCGSIHICKARAYVRLSRDF